MLNDPKLVREAFNDLAFSGRPDLETFTLLRDGKHGKIVPTSLKKSHEQCNNYDFK